MVGRSQQPEQVMETQTPFNLSAAIQSWQQELAVQPGFTSDNRRELETHLHETLVELRQRGLNEEEAFWLARRRLGPPQQLSEEFAKADPVKVWRERVFWIALALLAVQLWTLVCQISIGVLAWYERILPEWVLFYFRNELIVKFAYSFVSILPFVCFLILLARDRIGGGDWTPKFLFRSRWRFALIVALLLPLS